MVTLLLPYWVKEIKAVHVPAKLTIFSTFLSKTYKHALINTLVADLGGQTYCKSHMYSNTVCVYKLDGIHPTGINIPMETKTHAPVFVNFLGCILINLFCCLQIRICFQLHHIFSDVFI
jgi:hypothetical protein